MALSRLQKTTSEVPPSQSPWKILYSPTWAPRCTGRAILDPEPRISDKSITTYQTRIESATQKKDILVSVPITAKFTEFVSNAKVCF